MSQWQFRGPRPSLLLSRKLTLAGYGPRIPFPLLFYFLFFILFLVALFTSVVKSSIMVRRSTPILWCTIQPWICQAASISTLPEPDDSVFLPRQVNGAVSSSTFLRRGYHTCEHCRPQHTMSCRLIKLKLRFWTGECTLTAARFLITAVPTSTFNTVSKTTHKQSAYLSAPS